MLRFLFDLGPPPLLCSQDSKVPLHDKAVGAYSEAKAAASAALRIAEAGESPEQQQELTALARALSGALLDATTQRLMALIGESKQRFLASLQRQLAGQSQGRPQKVRSFSRGGKRKCGRLMHCVQPRL